MKVVIMAAGKGTRMLPLTEDIPKVLVEVNNKPFLYYLIKNLQKAGYNDFCIIAGYKKEKIIEFLDNYGFEATIVEQKEQLGTGHAVLQAKEFVEQDDFLVLGGDNLWSVEDIKKINSNDEYNYVSGVRVETPQNYGVLIEENGKLKKIKEKPKEFFGNIINSGLYKFKPEIFSLLENLKPSPRGEIELTDAISTLAEQGKVKVIKIKDFWKDFGCLEDIPKMSEFLKDYWQE
jgi:UDP-N-acetylglucosamine diphosphorylase / glucose-1-phosphate thymidylyltransferase / UDP-N-acetylgalactosamine diphosphorylase / glucosamine-1-phosphate N-acetyltransferase / galactosamine-1-phosphate N-acetyltransferase